MSNCTMCCNSQGVSVIICLDRKASIYNGIVFHLTFDNPFFSSARAALNETLTSRHLLRRFFLKYATL